MKRRLAVLRQAIAADIAGMQRVRRSVRENRLITTTISDAEVHDAIDRTGRGWVVEDGGEIVAFAIGNSTTGNIWALFVHPDHERRGYGRLLHDTMIDWLFAKGLDRLWLTTDRGTRAQGFYQAAGWQLVGSTDGGELRFERAARGSPANPGGLPDPPDAEARVFFYGLFMDAESLVARGFSPRAVTPAILEGWVLQVGKRATLAASAAQKVHGIVMTLSAHELARLYSEPGLSDYRPVQVTVRLASGEREAAACYNLPSAASGEPPDQAYVGKLRDLARKLGFPAAYVASIGRGSARSHSG